MNFVPGYLPSTHSSSVRSISFTQKKMDNIRETARDPLNGSLPAVIPSIGHDESWGQLSDNYRQLHADTSNIRMVT